MGALARLAAPLVERRTRLGANAAFPCRYLWGSIRRGCHARRYEADARTYAAARLRASKQDSPTGDV